MAAIPTPPRSLSSPFVPWRMLGPSSSSTLPMPVAMPMPMPLPANREPRSPFTTSAFRPNSRSYLHLVPHCVELYFRHVYPIMPLVYMPAIRTAVARPGGMEPAERNLIYALCALTSFHMSGKSLSSPTAAMGAAVPAPAPSWEAVGRFFLDECIAARQGRDYDFLEDVSLGAAVSSFWLSTSFFEISQSRKSWYYLREALGLALDLGLHDDTSYRGLAPEDVLCRQRVFWILFITERSFAILRKKPLTLRRAPRLPARGHPYEGPEIHAGFVKLVRSYMPLDESFVNAWNDVSDHRVSAATYLHLQEVLAQPLDFLDAPQRRAKTTRRTTESALSSSSLAATTTATSTTATMTGAMAGDSARDGEGGRNGVVVEEAEMETDTEPEPEPEPTAIQKADLLVTQQWLRLVVWQSSLQHELLSMVAPNESMAFSFPLAIARDTVTALQALPSHAIEVHGMGIFEKLFEIGSSYFQVLGAYDSGGGASSPHRHQRPPFGGEGGGEGGGLGSSAMMTTMMMDSIGSGSASGGGSGRSSRIGVAATATASGMGMDHLRGDLSLLTQGGRAGIHTDPLEFFVKMLSSSPNSRTQFAEKLLMLASESPSSMRTALSPAPSTSTTSSTRTTEERQQQPMSGSGGGLGGEVSSDDHNNQHHQHHEYHSNHHDDHNEARDENAFVLKTELSSETTSNVMEGIKVAPPEWETHAGGYRGSGGGATSLSINTGQGLMGVGPAEAGPGRGAPPPPSLSTSYSDLTSNGEDYGVCGTTTPPQHHDFVGRGGGPWSAPVGGGFFAGGMQLTHEGVVVEHEDDRGRMAMASSVPRTQPENFSNGMLGVW
ncbi:hypothetical protein SLS62_008991 [Diatrype stigma]|uniref:Xylanolytic transcriptional activator regulatory domain-containing protein n=1 Tax=Diatrype stigma TaxID=117547 RepID=A0AAN9YME7_9PEZI